MTQGCSVAHRLYAPGDGKFHAQESGFLSLIGLCPKLVCNASAVIIRPGLAITNKHVVAAMSSPTIRDIKGKEIPVEQIIQSDKYDLALLYIPCNIVGMYPVGSRINNGEEMSALGTSLIHPYFSGSVLMETFPFIVEGVELYDATKDSLTGLPVNSGFLYAGATKGGFSGGPVFNKKGELVGMNQGLVTKGQVVASGSTYGVAYHLEDLIKEVNQLTDERDHCTSER